MSTLTTSDAFAGSAPTRSDLRDSDRIAFLRLRGVLDDRTVLSFKKSVFNIPPEKRVLVLDLARLEQATNAGLGALLDALRYFRKRNGLVFLVHPNEELELLLLHFRAGEIARTVRSYEEVLTQLPAVSGEGGNSTGDFESTLTHLNTGNGPAVHYHYYGKEFHPPEPEAGKPLNVFTADPLQELSGRLRHLQNLMESHPAAQSERLEKKLDEVAGAEGRLVERLQTMERSLREAVENRLDRMEARVLDRIDHHGPAEVSSAPTRRPGASFPGYRMAECEGCGKILRVRQSGRHMCPACHHEFTVSEKGETEF